jgi:hypothetical protein
MLTLLAGGCSRLAPAGQTITHIEFYQLRDGISYSQAQDIVGAPGQLQSTRNAFTTYVWNNADGSKAIVVFQDDRLWSKNWYRSSWDQGTSRKRRLW